MNVAPFDGEHKKVYERALIVSSSKETNSCIEKEIGKSGTTLLFASTEELTYDYLTNTEVSYIIVDASLSYIGSREFIRSLREKNSAGKSIPIILLASQREGFQLSSMLSSGYDDVLFDPFTSHALSARLSSIEKIRELNALYQSSVNEQLLAKKILMNAIDEISIKIDEISLLSISKNIFSGDIFMTARHPDGSLNILLADFTGHGLSAAICALPVANIFSTMTEKGFDVDYIVENLNNKLYTLLPTSMFMACSFLSISSDLKHIKVLNGGMPDIYIRNNITGNIRHKISSSHLPLGITEADSNQFNPVILEIAPGDMLILFTDGLTEAMDSYNDMFGEHRVEKCLHDCSDEEPVFRSVVNAFDSFCGDVSPVDDVTLAIVPCTMDIMEVRELDD